MKILHYHEKILKTWRIAIEPLKNGSNKLLPQALGGYKIQKMELVSENLIDPRQILISKKIENGTSKCPRRKRINFHIPLH